MGCSLREKGFESGDKVHIHCLGRWNGRVGKVKGKVYDEESGIFLHGYYVDLNFDTPEPYTEVFAEEHLELIVEPEEEEKAGEIKDSGERTEMPQENNGVNIWIKNAFGMGTIIVEVIGGDVHLFMENQKQDCTIVGQI